MTKKESTLVKLTALVGGVTFLSRVAGFFRDLCVAHFLGTTGVADSFFIAFKLPNFFRRFFAEGAFSVAFIPVYSKILNERGQNHALVYAHQLFTFLTLFLIVFVGLNEVFMPQILGFLTPGFSESSPRFTWAIELSRITFPYIMSLSLCALYGGILNVKRHFFAPAASPILLNIAMIISLFLTGSSLWHASLGLAYGVVAAGIVQLIWLISVSRSEGIVLRFVRPRWTADVRKFFRLLLPASISAGVVQINLLCGVLFASLLPSGAFSYLFYADRLAQLPLGVIGISLSTTLLPSLSDSICRNQTEKTRHLQSRAIEIGMILTVPASLGLMVLAHPIISLLYVRGAFTVHDAYETGRTLVAFALGVPAFVLVRILSTTFFARRNTRMPALLTFCSVVINVGLNILFYKKMAHVGIALATSIASWVHVVLLVVILWVRDDFHLTPSLKLSMIKLMCACLGMVFFLVGVPSYFGRGLTAPFSSLETFFLIAGGVISFLAMGWMIRLFPRIGWGFK